jgi:hypothetical protein
MAVSTGGLLRLIAIGLVMAVAACSPVERPTATAPTAALPPPPATSTVYAAPADTTVTPPTPTPAPSAAAMTTSAAGATAATPLVKAAPIPISIAPVTGTPGAMRYSMEDALKKYAASRNFIVVPAEDPTVVYRLKGRVTAVGDTSGGLLVYVWDVMDAAGTRVHRVAGQQVAGATQADPWAGVTGINIDNAAREIIDGLADWVRGQSR